jgi:ATP-dependent DNA helicase RecQ
MIPAGELETALRKYWGYDSFRPLQERIVRSLLAGNDACVVMPTGGGKSLCYQLPALLSGKTAVVVSPLIALMQDQAAQLAQIGIPAAVLNSSVTAGQQSSLISNACRGEYRLLYVSPERLARADTMDWLQRIPIAFFAVDEAHCISEWGHEFRPEYRQLQRLRTSFPNRPIAAFTASATQRVRHDILSQLQLRNPDKYIASFHRTNLRYLIRECHGREQQELLVAALRQHPEGSVIVYAPTIETVKLTVNLLKSEGIPAIAYHGKMESEERRRNQERWMSDEVRVLVGTIAFGLGINKATVRAVIHLSLPKSIEQYYQEAGRAGRDGEPANCILLWQKRDAGLLAHFIEQVSDPAERERSWERYHTIRHFVESDGCRHRYICLHFGERTKWETCGSCDACGALPAWLAPAYSSKRNVAKFPAASKGLARDKVSAPLSPVFVASVNSELREFLRQRRREIAKEQGVPAFVVMHDTSLEEICRLQPMSIPELLRVHGFGERKAAMYGEQIFGALKSFRDGARATSVESRESADEQPLRRSPAAS